MQPLLCLWLTSGRLEFSESGLGSVTFPTHTQNACRELGPSGDVWQDISALPDIGTAELASLTLLCPALGPGGCLSSGLCPPFIRLASMPMHAFLQHNAECWWWLLTQGRACWLWYLCQSSLGHCGPSSPLPSLLGASCAQGLRDHPRDGCLL